MDTIGIGTRVRYFDMANPLRTGTITGEIDAFTWAITWDAEFVVLYDFKLHSLNGVDFHDTVTKSMLDRGVDRQAGRPGTIAGWGVVDTPVGFGITGDTKLTNGVTLATAIESMRHRRRSTQAAYDRKRPSTRIAHTEAVGQIQGALRILQLLGVDTDAILDQLDAQAQS